MKVEKNVTVRDIAKAAGVSAATVSLVLNDKGRLSEERRETIKKIAKNMGYALNLSLRTTRQTNSGCIGVVVNQFNDPFLEPVLAGINAISEERGIAFAVSQSHNKKSLEEKYCQMFTEQRMDGLIVLPCDKQSDHLVNIAEKNNIPIVLLYHNLGDRFATVQADNFRGADKIAEHFLTLGKGREHIHLTAFPETSSQIARKEGFCKRIQYNDTHFSPDTHVFCLNEVNTKSIFNKMDEILEVFHTPINIFAVNDDVAIGILQYCRKKNINIPNNIAVAGFSDIKDLNLYEIPLTTIQVPAKRMGENVLELLLDMKNNERIRKYPPLITLPVNLIIRESTLVV